MEGNSTHSIGEAYPVVSGSAISGSWPRVAGLYGSAGSGGIRAFPATSRRDDQTNGRYMLINLRQRDKPLSTLKCRYILEDKLFLTVVIELIYKKLLYMRT